MIDVCVNHFAWAGDPSSVQYNQFTPFNDSSYFHPYCELNATSSQTQVCIVSSFYDPSRVVLIVKS